MPGLFLGGCRVAERPYDAATEAALQRFVTEAKKYDKLRKNVRSCLKCAFGLQRENSRLSRMKNGLW